MPSLFVDTSGWACLLDPNQPFHPLAVSLYRAARSARTQALTTNYVIAELIPLMTSRAKMQRGDVVDFVDKLKSAALIRIVHIDDATDREAWTMLKSRQDKDWSLVDCASFVLMKRLGLTEALTTDHHFEQAGFIRLLK
jgi:predicted nucleic acid-binding protein